MDPPSNKDKVGKGPFLTWSPYYAASASFHFAKPATTTNEHCKKRIKRSLMEQQSLLSPPTPPHPPKNVHFMIQDCNEWKHVRLVSGFVQGCYQRGATMAGKTEQAGVEHKVFCFSDVQSPWGAPPGRTITPKQVYCLCLDTRVLACLLFGFFFFFLFFFGSERSSLPRRQVIKDKNKGTPERYHRECEDLHLHHS